MLIGTGIVILASFCVVYALSLLTQPRRIYRLFLGLGFGMIAFGVAFSIQNALFSSNILSIRQIQLFSAPLLEELLKAVFLATLITRVKWLEPGEGLLYGFGVGIGFALVESVIYMMVDPAQALNIAVARSVSVNLMHGVGVGLLGFGIAFRVQKRIGCAPVLVLIVAAVVIHAASNVLTIERGIYGTAGAIALSMAGIIFLTALSKITLRPISRTTIQSIQPIPSTQHPA